MLQESLSQWVGERRKLNSMVRRGNRQHKGKSRSGQRHIRPLSKWIKNCLDFRILNSASSGSAASCSLGWRQAMGNVARWWPAVCCQFHLSSHWCQEGSRLEQRGCPAGHQWGHRWPRGSPLLEVRMWISDLQNHHKGAWGYWINDHMFERLSSYLIHLNHCGVSDLRAVW